MGRHGFSVGELSQAEEVDSTEAAVAAAVATRGGGDFDFAALWMDRRRTDAGGAWWSDNPSCRDPG